MAIPSIKATYSLDVETVRTLERIANRWKVSKSEALRRAIRAVADEPDATDAVTALDHLQQALNLTPADARAWSESGRTERREASERSERRER